MIYLSKEDLLTIAKNAYGDQVVDEILLFNIENNEPSFFSSLNFDGQDGRYAYLAKIVSEWACPFSACFFLVTEYGLFPSRENIQLIHRIRVSYSEYRPVFLAPGHIFSGFEVADLATHLHLAMLFGWSGVVISAPDKFLHFSHDGHMRIFGGAAHQLSENW